MSELNAPAAELAASQGWELMKIHRAPRLVLWKADDGWEGAWEVIAGMSDTPGVARITADRWNSAIIVPDYHPN